MGALAQRTTLFLLQFSREFYFDYISGFFPFSFCKKIAIGSLDAFVKNMAIKLRMVCYSI